MKIFLLSVLVVLSACSGEKKLTTIQGETMGTYYKVTVYTDENPKALKVDIDKFLKLFNQIFSTYEKDSELSKINKSQLDKFIVSDSMKKMLNLSQEISVKSRGYFDITVGPLVNLWGFGPDGKRKLPSDELVSETLEMVGFEKLELKDNRFQRPQGMYIDMSAIAKGFGVDELVKFLEFRGYGNLLVEIGGEVRARGKKQDGSLWKVGIEGPSENLGAKLIKVVQLDNLSMATSGSYRNYQKYGDKIFNHTIDPKTGYPVKHKTVSVSVVSEYCADADAWATALMSIGYEQGMELANQLDLMVFFQFKQNGQILTKPSVKFQKLLKK